MIRRRKGQPSCKGYQRDEALKIEVVSAPDTAERLRRAYDLILRAAARAEEQPPVETSSDQKASDDE